MEQIEEIKKILTEVRSVKGKYHSPEISNEEIAHQINALFPQGDDEGLLSIEEQIPFVHTGLADYGVVTVGEEVWDIGGLLKAQRDLTRQERDAEITKLKEESEARRELIRRLTDKGLALIAEGQERLDRPDREKIKASIRDVLQDFHQYSSCFHEALSALIPDEEEIRKKVKEIQNPYTAEFFPRDDKWAGQILREKGLTDDEIGGVSGALGRVAFEYIMAEIDRPLEP